MTEETATTVEQETATQPEAEQQAPDLTINDLNALKSIIDVATQRGAFKANELMTVGQAYNKLESFLEAVTKTQGA